MKDEYMKDNPFTKEYEFDSSALDVIEKVRQNPVKVNGGPDRLKEGEEKLKKFWQAKAFAKELEVLPYKETQENLAKNVFITQEDREVLEKLKQPNIRQIVDFGLARKSGDKDDDQMTCTIICKMTREWMERFLKLLDVMQADGEIGHSETLSFFADGDGTFRPHFGVSELRKETGD